MFDDDAEGRARCRPTLGGYPFGRHTPCLVAFFLILLGVPSRHAPAQAADSVPRESARATAEATQPDADEIVVSARRRDEPPETVPLSLAVLAGREIEATGAYTLTRLQQLDPVLQVVAFNARTMSLFIRGLGGNVGPANDGLEGGVGVFLDDVYLGRQGAGMFELVDLERIEILRGPQGTLFGRNTAAGAINMVTKPPSFDGTELIAEASVGDFDFHQLKTSVSGPLRADVLAGRISVSDTHRDGFLENVATGERIHDFDNLTVRGQLLIAATSDLELRLIGDYARQEQVCCTLAGIGAFTELDGGALVADNFGARVARLGYSPLPFEPFERKIDVNAPLGAAMDQHGVSARVDWSFPGAQLTSISAYRSWDFNPTNDGDDTSLSVFTAFQVATRQEQLSHELRVASRGDRRLDYVGGLYYFHDVVDGLNFVGYGSDAPGWFFVSPSAVQSVALNGFGTEAASSAETRSDALFGTMIWHLTRALDLSAGLRFTRDRRQGYYDLRQVAGQSLMSLSADDAAAARAVRNSFGAPAAYAAEMDDDSLSGHFTLSYLTSGSTLGYVTMARGHKSGGVSIGVLPVGVDPRVQPETTDHLELGVKGTLLGGGVAYSAALYRSTIFDYQAAVVQTDPVSQRYLRYVANIDDVRSRGGELEATWSPNDRYSLSAALAHTDAEYLSYAHGPCPVEVSLAAARCDLSGLPLPGAPKRSWSVALDGRQPLFGPTELYWRLDYGHRSLVFSEVSDSRFSRLEPYGLANLRIGLRRADRRWDVGLWIRNLLDEDYLTLSLARTTGYVVAMLGDPRTIGVTFRGQY